MDKLEKFLRKTPRLRKHLENVMRLIGSGELDGLDIKPLRGQKNVFRCRVGSVRILFARVNGRNIPFDIDFRGNIYKK